VLVGALLVILTIKDYNPEKITAVELENNQETLVDVEQTYTFYSWNIGYGGLGAEEDFFMDGGTKGRPDKLEDVERYLDGILNEVKSYDADFVLLQEVDVDARRTFGFNEKKLIDEQLPDYSSSFGKNYDVLFVPVPLPPIGRVKSGIVSYSHYQVEAVDRYALPGEYDWPVRVAQLDRCMLVSRLPVEGKDEELVVVNAHFSAYDDGSIRATQLAFIKDFVVSEYEKGNYVVLGGDWNQTFPEVNRDLYPVLDNGKDNWRASQIEDDWIDEGWTFGHGKGVPTYRLLNEPYNEGVTQTGVIDGFLVSPNVTIEDTEVVDLGFEYSDHNPVKVMVRFD
jgi:endonuclease/exonuclease/phosphatase family metal-dependent hydrolase